MVTVTPWPWPCVELLCTWRDENPRCSDCRSLRHFKVSGDLCQTAACGVPRTPPSSATRLSERRNELRSHPGGCFHIVAPVVFVSSADANCCIFLPVLSSSGHGFKFGPLIGKLLCELSQGEKPSHDLSPFRISRFHEKIKSAL